MKTLNFTIDNAFVRGLHTERIAARNRDVLNVCKNMRPTEYGLAFNTAISEPLSSPPAVNWPYPQLFKGRNVTLLADDQAVYTVNESTGVLTALTVYQIATAMEPATESVTDGDMSSSANWTEGTGHSVTGGKLVLSSAADATETSQANGDQASAIAATRLYRCVYTIDSITSGGVRIEIGGAVGTTRTEAGTYTEDIIATSSTDIVIAAVGTTTATIDDVSVKRISEGTIPAGGGAWQFVDFQGCWFLFKNGCVVAKVPYYSDARPVIITESANDFSCLAGARQNSRLFLGGITAESRLSTSEWDAAWNAWIENSAEWSDEVTYENQALTPSTLFYSTRVGGDMQWPFIIELALFGFSYRNDSTTRADMKANYVDWIRKGEMGFVPLQHQGSILNLKPLGNGIVAYCEDGVSYITPREDRGYRARVLHSAGIASKCAVAGDETRHIFVDTNDVQWEFLADGSKNRLCGVGTFDTMVTNESTNPIIGTHDPEEGEFYLCSDQDGYVRTRTGLGQVTKFPTSLVIMNGALASGGVEDLGDATIDITTETFDMGLRSLKSLKCVHVGYSDITSLDVTVHYKYDQSDSWRTAGPFTINTDNVATPVITAHDFRLEFNGTPGNDAKIDYVFVEYQVADKRNFRSQYEN